MNGSVGERDPAGQRLVVTLTINGAPYRVAVDAGTTLLDLLRDDLGLTGTKKGCGLGHCGACTVIVDDRRVNSCLLLAVMQEGRAVQTVEGLTDPAGTLDPVQAAFIARDALQCGYCTPGQIMSAHGCLAEGDTAGPTPRSGSG